MIRKSVKLLFLEDQSRAQRSVTVSVNTLRLLGACFAVFMVFSSVMTWGFLFYRTHNTKVASQSIALLEHEKAELISKIGALEGTISRIEKFTEKLEASIGVESGKLNMGVGPVAEQENLGEFLTRLHKTPQLTARSMDRDWREGKFDDKFYDKVSFKLDELYEFAATLEERVNEVYEANEDQVTFWASTPSLWPVHGWITSGFGYRLSPWGEGVKMHKGIDIASPYGTPVFAPSDGTVVFSGYKGGYGQAVVLDHGYGVTTLYGHNSELFVSEGDQIKRGSKLALVGSTGSSTGPHLHYEVHVDGVPTDPMKYILQ